MSDTQDLARAVVPCRLQGDDFRLRRGGRL